MAGVTIAQGGVLPNIQVVFNLVLLVLNLVFPSDHLFKLLLGGAAAQEVAEWQVNFAEPGDLV